MKARLWKRVLSVFLVACMVWNSFSGFAVEGDTVQAAEAEDVLKLTRNTNNSTVKQTVLFMEAYPAEGSEVVYEMDYLLVGGTGNTVVKNIAGSAYGEFPDDETGTNTLQEGQHHYKASFTGSGQAKHFGIRFNVVDDAVLYVWNIKATINGEEQTIKTKDEILNTGELAKEYVSLSDIGLGCTHDYEAVVTPPTAMEQGYTTHTCSKCGDSYVDSYTDPVEAALKLTTDSNSTEQYQNTWFFESWPAEGSEIVFEMDYSLVGGSGTATAKNIAGGDFADDTTGSATLQRGEHHFKSSFTVTSGAKHFGIQITKGDDAVLYVWNVKATINGEEQTLKTKDVILTTGSLVKEYVPLSEVEVECVHYYEAVVTPPTVMEQGYTTHTCSKCGDSYVDSYTDPVEAALKLTTDSNSTEQYQNTWFFESWPAEGSEIVFEMDYSLVGGSGTATAKNIAGGSFADDTTGSATLQRGEHHFKSSFTVTSGAKHFGIQINKGDDAVLYVWNVKATINGEEQTLKTKDVILTTGSLVKEYVPLSEVKVECVHDYEAVVTSPTVMEQGYTTHTCSLCGDSYVDSYTDPIEAALKITTDPNSEEVHQNTWFFESWPAEGSEIVFEMDYSLVGGSGTATAKNIAGGSFADDTTGSATLQRGEHHFKSSFTVTSGAKHFGIQINKGDDAVLYVWNVKATINGEEQTLKTKDVILTTGSLVKEYVPLSEVEVECTHDYEAVVTPPTIMEQGYTTHTCSLCGDSYVDSYTDPIEAALKITTDPTSEEAHQNTWFMESWPAEGSEIVFEMDYSLVGGNGTATAKNIAGGSFADDTTGSATLQRGEHHFKSSFTVTSGAKHFGIQINKGDDAVLYVWNVKATINGEEYTLKTRNQILETGSLVKEFVPLDEIEYDTGDTPEDDTTEDDTPKYALKITVDPNSTEQHQNTWFMESWPEEGSEIVFEMDYSLVGGNGTARVKNIAGGEFPDDTTKSASLQRGEHHYKSSFTVTSGAKHFGIQIEKGDDAVLYVWNVKAYINGVEYPLKTDEEILKTGSLVKEFVPFDKVEYDSGEESNKDTTVYAFKITTNKNSKKDTQNMWFMTTYPEKGQKVVFEMDYYLEGGDETARVSNIHDGSNLPNDATGFADLELGKNHYKGTFRGKGEGLHFGISMRTSDDAVLYVWNVKVYIDGVEQQIFSNEEILKTGTLNKKLIKYKDIVFKPVEQPDPNHPANIDNNPGGKLMLKQENYKNREEYGILQYQEFVQYVGANANGSKIKENTTYVFSFDYYADPGLFGSGVNSANALVKSLHTGHNDVITGPNKHMLYDEEQDRYSGYLLPNVGRHHIEIEFTTFPGQTDLIVGIVSGWDGDAYYWDFSLVEKDGNGENLLTSTAFEGPFSSMCTSALDSSAKRAEYWKISEHSADAMGTYSFVPFDEVIDSLNEGDVLEVKTEEPKEEKTQEEVPVVEIEEDDGDSTGIIVGAVAAVCLVGCGIAVALLKKKKKENAA